MCLAQHSTEFHGFWLKRFHAEAKLGILYLGAHTLRTHILQTNLSFAMAPTCL